MPLVEFSKLMRDAAAGGYAVGYFESWNLESLQAVADAAEAMRSPVILGFSGIYLPHPDRVVKDRLRHYAALGRDVGASLTVPACLVFNECANLDWVFEAIGLEFGLVMFTDERLDYDRQLARVRETVRRAHAKGVAVEAETTPLPGAGGGVVSVPDRPHLTDPDQARRMVAETGVDALAVDIGQVHLHGRRRVRLDLGHLHRLRETVPVPLVLHGASSVAEEDLAAAIRLGITKINVGSQLKRVCFDAMRRKCAEAGEDYNPYEVIGSGLSADVLVAGRLALQQSVEQWMRLFGSAGKA